VLTGVGVDVLNFFEVRAGIFKSETGAENSRKYATPLISDIRKRYFSPATPPKMVSRKQYLTPKMVSHKR